MKWLKKLLAIILIIIAIICAALAALAYIFATTFYGLGITQLAALAAISGISSFAIDKDVTGKYAKRVTGAVGDVAGVIGTSVGSAVGGLTSGGLIGLGEGIRKTFSSGSTVFKTLLSGVVLYFGYRLLKYNNNNNPVPASTFKRKSIISSRSYINAKNLDKSIKDFKNKDSRIEDQNADTLAIKFSRAHDIRRFNV